MTIPQLTEADIESIIEDVDSAVLNNNASRAELLFAINNTAVLCATRYAEHAAKLKAEHRAALEAERQLAKTARDSLRRQLCEVLGISLCECGGFEQ